MSSIALLAFLRGCVWATLLYVAIRHRSRLSVVAVLGAWVGNLLLALGLTQESGAVGIATAALVVYLLVDRLDKDPAHVQHVAALQITDARREMHDAVNDARAWEARFRAAERVLREHGIRL